MNFKRYIVGVFLLCIWSSFCKAQKIKNIVTQGLCFCESTYSLGEELLIANFGSSVLNPLNTERKGYVLSYSHGKLKTFIPANGYLSAPKGMFATKHFLFICDVNQVFVYDLQVLDTPCCTIHFAPKEMMLNGITGNDSWIFVSVTNTGNIYRFKVPVSSTSSIIPELYTHIAGANGLIMDGKSMYIASYPVNEVVCEENKIYMIEDINMDNPVPRKLNVTPGKYDGLAFSPDHKILYATNWDIAGVITINMLSGSIRRMDIQKSISIKGPAAISVSNGILFIPDLPNSRVVEVQLK